MARNRIATGVAIAGLAAGMIAAHAVVSLPDASAADGKTPVTRTAPARVPSWGQLRADQRRILAPLREDWEHLEPQRKLKWIEIAGRYPKLAADEQARIVERMKAWASLTPEQRRVAREFYKDIDKLPPEKKQEVRQKWEEYQQLPEGKRQQYAARPKQAEDQASAQGDH